MGLELTLRKIAEGQGWSPSAPLNATPLEGRCNNFSISWRRTQLGSIDTQNMLTGYTYCRVLVLRVVYLSNGLYSFDSGQRTFCLKSKNRTHFRRKGKDKMIYPIFKSCHHDDDPFIEVKLIWKDKSTINYPKLHIKFGFILFIQIKAIRRHMWWEKTIADIIPPGQTDKSMNRSLSLPPTQYSWQCIHSYIITLYLHWHDPRA